MSLSKSNSFTKTLTRQWWNLERFGLTPAKLVRRFGNRSVPRVVCNCIPKSGTHLLERTLCLHPQLYRRLVKTVRDQQVESSDRVDSWLAGLKSGQMYFCHLLYRDFLAEAMEKHDVRCLFMVRDLRDVLVSDVLYVPTDPRHRYHDLYVRQPDVPSRLKYALLGDPSENFPSFGERMGLFAGWLDHAHVVRFEDLIGESGGGDKSCQRETLEGIFQYLGLDMNREQIEALSRRVFSNVSPTFRKGHIGTAHDYLDDELKQIFDDEAGELMARFGYEVPQAAPTA